MPGAGVSGRVPPWTKPSVDANMGRGKGKTDVVKQDSDERWSQVKKRKCNQNISSCSSDHWGACGDKWEETGGVTWKGDSWLGNG